MTNMTDMTRTFRSLALLATLLLLTTAAPHARAQLSTKDPSLLGPTLRAGERTIIEPRTMTMYLPLKEGSTLMPEIEINRQGELGYDIVYTFTNTTQRAEYLGRLVVGTITMRHDVHYLNVHRGSQLHATTADRYAQQAWRYPLDAYSPLCAIMDDEFAVGVSLLYPILEYKHDALVRLANPGGVFKGPKDARGWFIAFDLSNAKGTGQHTALMHQALLRPGETRTYTVAVRAQKRTNTENTGRVARQDWLDTLEPYRAYFREQHGGVQYERDPSPVRAVEAANNVMISDKNPRGFFGDNSRRPDLGGFGPLADLLARPDGYERVMLWAPSGLYNSNTRLNYPPAFTDGWDDLPLMRTTYRRLQAVEDAGKKLGLWWGRSTEYAEHWNPEKLESLDIENRDHLRSISRQLRLAEEAGASIIGLDNFTHAMLPVWDEVRLLRAMKTVFPDLKFVVEPMCCDIIHAATPGFISAFRAPKDGRERLDFHKLRTPHYLADYLIPGHETWALYRYSEVQRVDRSEMNANRVQADAEHLASLGFVPVMLTHHTLRNPRDARAEQTWTKTAPPLTRTRATPNAQQRERNQRLRSNGRR